MNFVTTQEISARAIYKDTGASFFAMFPAAWDAVRCQVLKLETRQSYQEPDSGAWRTLDAGDLDEAIRLIPDNRTEDLSLYTELQRRGVEFLRCRPLEFPLSRYMRWELEVYKFNSSKGERIFCCNRKALEEVFASAACNDFMVFDARCALIHDYDDSGLIRGGWYVENQADIRALIGLFGFIKANSQSFQRFLPA